jgi:plasmid replication initiation protein
VATTDPAKYLPIGVQKSYFLLPKAEREILDTALKQYQPGQSDPVLVGGSGLLKTALRLMSDHRIKIEGIDNAQTVYTRWIESVQVRGEKEEVYLTFSPRFKRIWTQAKKRMPDYVAQNPANAGLRSKYALRLYGWAKKHSAAGSRRITVKDIRKLLGLESVKDTAGNIIREAPLAVWANLRQRALDTAIAEINKKTDLHVEIKSLVKLGTRVEALNFSIITQEIPKGVRAKS